MELISINYLLIEPELLTLHPQYCGVESRVFGIARWAHVI